MNLFATSAEWLLWPLVALLIGAAAQDAVQLKISNWITGFVVILAAAAAAVSGVEIAIWQNLAAFAVVLTLGFALFSYGVLGGGDVKLLAAVALWTNGSTLLTLIASILLAGGILAIIIIALRMFAREGFWRHVRVLRPGSGIPYGIAIAAGTMVFLSMTSSIALR